MRLSSPSMWFRKRPRRFSGNRLAAHRSPPVMRGQGPPIKPRPGTQGAGHTPKALSVLSGFRRFSIRHRTGPYDQHRWGRNQGSGSAPNERGACRRTLARAPEPRPSHHPRLVSTVQNALRRHPVLLGRRVVHRLTIIADVSRPIGSIADGSGGAWGEPCSNDA